VRWRARFLMSAITLSGYSYIPLEGISGTLGGMKTTYDILGMTCAHCARAVSEHLGALGGVTGVDVDVAEGRAVVTSSVALDPVAVAVAVGEAGYTLGRPDRLRLP